MTKKKAIFDAVRQVDGTALTTTYAAVGDALGLNAEIVHVFNDCNQPITISMDSGTTDHYVLAAAESFTIDLRANGLHIDDGGTIQAKENGTTPTAGSLRISVIRS